MSDGIGDALRAARAQTGVTLADAAAETRIRESYLAALEDEHFEHLGGDVYVKGFLRSYARYLGIDPEPLVEAYRSHHQEVDDWGSMTSEPVASPPEPRRPIAVIVTVLAVLIVGGLAYLGFQGEADTEADDVAAPDPVEEETTEPPDPDPEPTDVEQDDEPGDEDAEAAEDDGGDDEDETEDEGDEDAEADDDPSLENEVILTFSVVGGGSWARVTVDGTPVAEGLYDPGFSETFEGDEVLVRIGDAGSAEVEVNGEDLGDIGGSGQVVEVLCSTQQASCEVEVVA